jgi:UDP-N-acetylglucosamine 2-epimerase (hydrolysing)
MKRKVLFITGTRADWGKLKPLISDLSSSGRFSLRIFATGMHMLERHGSTWEEVRSFGVGSVHPFVNQSPNDSMEQILSKTITGLSDYVRENRPDLIVVHGDRVEALAGAVVGAFSNVLVAHIEGGELSGTIDELIRHAVSKLSHLHYVANEDSKRRLVQMGELPETVFIIGSPDVDVMNSATLPRLEEALDHYGLPGSDYAIMIYHPVTTDLNNVESEVDAILQAQLECSLFTIVVESNNDTGSDIIRAKYREYEKNHLFKFFPSMRFEYFLTLLKNARYIVGNSSAGVREAPHYGVPAVNVGSRQLNRVKSKLVINAMGSLESILEAIRLADISDRSPERNFGDGRSSQRFTESLFAESLWMTNVQKQFRDTN